jgi:hypothetical protein
MYSNGPLNIAAGTKSIGISATAIPARRPSLPPASRHLPLRHHRERRDSAVATFTAPTAAVAATAGSGFDDRGWTIGASYNFMGNLLVGIQYIDMRYELAARREVKKKNWFLGADWNFAGPHHILGAYVNAGNTKGCDGRTDGGIGPDLLATVHLLPRAAARAPTSGNSCMAMTSRSAPR